MQVLVAGVEQVEYTIDEHRHRFAAWAASRAASVINCRFSVEQGKKILELAGMRHLISNPDNLPTPEGMDAAHRQWRHAVIDAARSGGLDFTHGIAAKLINVYLKAAFVCGGYHDHERVRGMHPPIDSLVLDGLYSKDIGGKKAVWKEARRIRFSNFDSGQYERVIKAIRDAMKQAPLWEVERYWPGYQ
jgi:hypothetical protein